MNFMRGGNRKLAKVCSKKVCDFIARIAHMTGRHIKTQYQNLIHSERVIEPGIVIYGEKQKRLRGMILMKEWQLGNQKQLRIYEN